jgi:hypothetical protein
VVKLTKNGKSMWVQLVDTTGSIEVLDAIPLPGSPAEPNQKVNTGIHKLAIHRQGVTTTTFDVRITPANPTNSTPPAIPPASAPLGQWK